MLLILSLRESAIEPNKNFGYFQRFSNSKVLGVFKLFLLRFKERESIAFRTLPLERFFWTLPAQVRKFFFHRTHTMRTKKFGDGSQRLLQCGLSEFKERRFFCIVYSVSFLLCDNLSDELPDDVLGVIRNAVRLQCSDCTPTGDRASTSTECGWTV